MLLLYMGSVVLPSLSLVGLFQIRQSLCGDLCHFKSSLLTSHDGAPPRPCFLLQYVGTLMIRLFTDYEFSQQRYTRET